MAEYDLILQVAFFCISIKVCNREPNKYFPKSHMRNLIKEVLMNTITCVSVFVFKHVFLSNTIVKVKKHDVATDIKFTIICGIKNSKKMGTIFFY